LVACDDDALEPQQADAGPPPGGLTKEQAATVVAKVGDVTITLGDYAAALERMNQFDRLRYQTKERRRELLQEIVDMELLAQEAKRRGLDKEPEVQEAIRQILREAMIAESRKGIPPPAAIEQDAIQKYYDEHQEEFREPERRRVSVIVVDDKEKAEDVLQQALAAESGEAWGKLHRQHSVDEIAKPDPNAPADLAGDRGIVGPPGDAKGSSKAVPEPVRRAVFKVKEVGDVFPALVPYENRFFIVRLSGKSEGHTRSVSEADRAIRVAILQKMIAEREAELEKKLRKRFGVQVDEEALKKVKLPKGVEDYKPFWEEKAPPSGDAPEDDAQPTDG
jgi:parvulin-like peptidyl-prolyl isomerase